MVEFKEYAQQLKTMYQIESGSFFQDLTKFLVDNGWFGITPVWKDRYMYIEPSDFQEYLPRIQEYFANCNKSTNEKYDFLKEKLKRSMPDTSEKLETFYEKFKVATDKRCQVTSFILKYVKCDVCLLNDEKLKKIIEVLCEEETKTTGDCFTTFLSWCKKHYRTRYYQDYVLNQRSKQTSNGAVDLEDYLHLVYYLFNQEYIEKNDMYRRAAESKNYIDTWLFLALHFICALRDTDIVRLYHPKLKREPSEVLEMIKNGTFPEEEARMVLYSITWRLCYLPFQPNKLEQRKRHSGISDIKFHVPESAEVHIGTLFAIAEAHRLLAGVPDSEPLIRRIKSFDAISRYMGDEIGYLFLESDFRTRSINKSYLQSVFMETDHALDEEDEFGMKGYIMAALARSHKGSYGDFAKTTYIYLKDAKLSGLTPEFVARELFERGVLSFVPSMLLKMVSGGAFNKLSVTNQTKLIRELDMTPAEIETAVRTANVSMKRAVKTAKQIYSATDTETTLKALHRIGNGAAVSKMDECECLMSAFGRLCPYADKHNCMDCEYEISTKSTMFLMVSEYNRLMHLYHTADDVLEKEKNKYMLQEMVLPAMDEMITCIAEEYGESAVKTLEKIVKENINES